MSEQTPNSPDNMQDSSMGGGEPSMEDILASIRKIISEDEPVALESPEDVSAVLQSDAELESVTDDFDIMSALSEPLVPDAAPETAAPARSPDVVDLDIEAVLADMELNAKNSAAPAAAAPAERDSDDDILDILNMDIPMEPDVPAVTTPTIGGQAAALAKTFEPASPEDYEADEMDDMLNDILSMPDEETVAEAQPASVDNDPDLELVKSLMADLADDDAAESESHDDLEALLAIPEIEPETPASEISEAETVEAAIEEPEAAEAPELDASDDEDDILGDILNMTLDDEIDSHPEDLDLSDYAPESVSPDSIAADERANFDANSNLDANDIADQIEMADTADDLPSLADIAAAAEADAVAAESTPVIAPSAVAATVGLTAAGAGLAALGTTALGEEPVDETAQADTSTETHPDDHPDEMPPQPSTQMFSDPTPTTQEPSMPVQAVNTDTILDDVTESAAAGAFAQLNTVVEEKAVFNERGPRIGDLVQEALRPMLKEWLDANLKGIVERAVAKEVKRISTGK